MHFVADTFTKRGILLHEALEYLDRAVLFVGQFLSGFLIPPKKIIELSGNLPETNVFPRPAERAASRSPFAIRACFG